MSDPVTEARQELENWVTVIALSTARRSKIMALADAYALACVEAGCLTPDECARYSKQSYVHLRHQEVRARISEGQSPGG